jgi:hypothetical protein
VTQLFTDLLKRNVDAPSLAILAGRLTAGQLTRLQVTQFVTSSPEYQRVRVNDLYQRFLKRQADDVGLQAATGFLAQGGAIETVERVILGSDEFFKANPPTPGTDAPNDGFIKALYQDLFNRAPDTFGQGNLRLALSYPNVTHESAAGLLLVTEEFRQGRVNELFQTLLKRAATDNDRVVFSHALRDGARDEAVTATIAASDEYFARAQTTNTTTTQ